MNRFTSLIIAVVSTACTVLGEDASRFWGPEIEGYRISIQADKGSFACSEPIKLAIVLKNSASTTGRFSMTGIPEIDYPASILLPSPSWLPFRHQASLTDEGRRRTDQRRIMSFGGGPFRPGDERMVQLVLNTIYDMHWPGEYTVTVSAQVPRRYEKGDVTLTSNQLKLTVEPCKP